MGRSEWKAWLVNWNRLQTWRLLSLESIDEIAAPVKLRPVSSSVSRSFLYLLFARRFSSSDSGMRLNLAASFRPEHTVVFDGTRWIPLTLKDGVTCK